MNSDACTKSLLYILAFSIATGIFLRLVWGDDFTYDLFTERDLLRATEFFTMPEFLGAETSGKTSRTPGGAMPFITAILLSINSSPEFLRGLLIALDITAIFTIAFF